MDLLCGAGTLGGGALQSWRSFKLLKRRERLHAEIAQCADAEAALDLRVELQLATRAMRNVLKFWTVFALLQLWDTYAEPVACWVPFYYTLKLALVLWVMAANGASVIFAQAVEPFLDRHAAYIDDEALPRLRGAWLRAQAAAAGGFVALAKAAASEAQLADLQTRLEDMIDDIEREKARRRRDLADARRSSEGKRARGGDSGHMGDIGELGDAVFQARLASRSDGSHVQGQEPPTAGLVAGALASLWGAAAGAVWSSAAAASEASDARPRTPEPSRHHAHEHERMEHKEEAEEKVWDGEPGEAPRRGWMLGALDGMVGLTVGTRDLLLGNAAFDAASPSPPPPPPHTRDEREREGQQPRAQRENKGVDGPRGGGGDKATAARARGTAGGRRGEGGRARGLLDEYGPGFEELSECEDSDSGSGSDAEQYGFCNDPDDLPSPPPSPPAEDEEKRGRRGAARATAGASASVAEMRRRRPQTRSQAHNSSKR